VEYEPFEDSSSDFLPSSEEEDSDDMLPGPSKGKKKTDYKKSQSYSSLSEHTSQCVTLAEAFEGTKQNSKDRHVEIAKGLTTNEDSLEEDVTVDLLGPKNPSQISLRGKNGHRWSAVAGKTSRIPMKNKFHIIQGPTGVAKQALDPLEAFILFISNTVINEIVQHTNVEICIRSENYKDKKATTSSTCVMEIKALLGLLIFSGALKNNHLNAQSLFDETLCGTTYKAVMSRERFKFLINCLRFDDKGTRADRKETDPFAPIRSIWEELISNCKIFYKAGSYITIDEQLLAFRGRCPFRMYIPTKPAKYGIKIVMVCDAGTKYMVDASPYIGKKKLIKIICPWQNTM